MLIAAGITLALAGCDRGTGGEAAPGRVTHVVLCWLKEPGNPQQRAQLVEVSRTFSEIPGVLEVKAGTVVPSDRARADIRAEGSAPTTQAPSAASATAS